MADAASPSQLAFILLVIEKLISKEEIVVVVEAGLEQGGLVEAPGLRHRCRLLESEGAAGVKFEAGGSEATEDGRQSKEV